MKDRYNNEIKLGDKINLIYNVTSTSHQIFEGIVIGFTPQKIRACMRVTTESEAYKNNILLNDTKILKTEGNYSKMVQLHTKGNLFGTITVFSFFGDNLDNILEKIYKFFTETKEYTSIIKLTLFIKNNIKGKYIKDKDVMVKMKNKYPEIFL